MIYEKDAWNLVESMKVIFLGPIRDAEELLKGETPVLCHIAETGKITPTELARKFSLTTARIAMILNHLEKKNWIRRVHDTEDRRKVYIYPTDAGQKQAQVKMKELHQKLSEVLEALGEEDGKEYMRLTQKVARYLKENNESM